MKASDVLRKAAERIERDMRKTPWYADGCCEAISSVGGCGKSVRAKVRASQYLSSLFKNEESYWFGRPWIIGAPAVRGCNVDNQNHRIIALLLTADMAESVGD